MARSQFLVALFLALAFLLTTATAIPTTSLLTANPEPAQSLFKRQDEEEEGDDDEAPEDGPPAAGGDAMALATEIKSRIDTLALLASEGAGGGGGKGERAERLVEACGLGY